MGKKEQVASILQMVGGNAKHAERLVDEMERFFDSLNAEIEDWKISMEEYKDGTRVFARVQILIKK